MHQSYSSAHCCEVRGKNTYWWVWSHAKCYSHTYCIGFCIQCVKLWVTAIYQTFCKKWQVNYCPLEDLSARNLFHWTNKWRWRKKNGFLVCTSNHLKEMATQSSYQEHFYTDPYERKCLALCLIVKKTLETFMLEYFIANTSVSLVVKQNVNLIYTQLFEQI